MPASMSQSAMPDSLLGKTLGTYRIDGVLGRGGMGIAYRAQDLKLQRPVAVKLLPPELTADPERRKRFVHEARAAARVPHPAIAQVYDVGEQEGIIYIAMELVEGRTVADLVQSKDLDLLGAMELAIEVAEGLAQAHEAGIVHRDVKPANVMVTRDGHAKILDFGLAKLVEPTGSTLAAGPAGVDVSTMTQTEIGAIKGTPAYMSPEQIRAGAVDARSDLFSLGVMLFEMATGEAPFRRETPIETMHAVAFADTPSIHTRRPNLPVDLQRILTRCLEKRPEDRYADAWQLAQDLRRLRWQIESGRARPPSLEERVADAVLRLRRLKPSQHAWWIGAVIATALGVYLLVSNVSAGSLVFPAIVGLLLYRHFRHHRQRVLKAFVRKIACVPEVRTIVCHEQRITVVVDRAVSQLYGRIHTQLDDCNRKLFYGPPWSVAIRHDLAEEELNQLLSGPGVHYVRSEPEPDPTS
ncbi:MAG TPA: serine/threonine-protein kinase [Candidatus Paceibacterota bacterium]|nr:serine/threonine-protein kinase [Candidatus Paceibacterota bacterium]HRZ57876.1 serine/threonine-protein kinase [Candidatus Paceibacterota bacterium]